MLVMSSLQVFLIPVQITYESFQLNLIVILLLLVAFTGVSRLILGNFGSTISKLFRILILAMLRLILLKYFKFKWFFYIKFPNSIFFVFWRFRCAIHFCINI